MTTDRSRQWESQSRTRADSKTGLRYQRSKTDDRWKILLFVRQRAEDARGFTSPYLFLGRARYESHESEKPMRIVWKLDRMPPEFFAEVKIAAGYASWQAIETPRRRDDIERRPDKPPDEQLVAMFKRLRVALSSWMKALDQLSPSN